jgi:hypothetical protein
MILTTSRGAGSNRPKPATIHKGVVAIKKNPEQSMRSGFLSCVRQLGLLDRAAGASGGWGIRFKKGGCGARP